MIALAVLLPNAVLRRLDRYVRQVMLERPTETTTVIRDMLDCATTRGSGRTSMRQDRFGNPIAATDPAIVAAVNDHVPGLHNDEVRMPHILDVAEADGNRGG